VTIKLVSVEAGVEPSLLRTSIAYSRISLAEWLAGAASDADVLVWNNNLVMPAGAPGRTPNAKLVVNWGTGDVNIEQPWEWTDARLVTTAGYCTNTVRDFVLSCIGANTELKYGAAVGLVGIGRIGYSVAAALEPIVGSKGVLYTSRRPRPGLRFTPVALDELMKRADAIVVALNSHEPLDLKGLTKNRRRPLLLTISPEPVLPASQIAPLVDSGIVSAMVSDNPVPPHRPDLARFYTGKIAYRSERAKLHKHWILDKELLTVQASTDADPMIYIARHSETEWNRIGRRQGRLDSTLTARGIAQARWLAQFAQLSNVDCVYSSPLGRAHCTATIVANCLGVEVEVVNRFTEMDFGMLQGQLADREQAFPTFKTNRAIDPLHTSYPGGESYFDLALRVQPDIDRIASVGRTALIVGHGSVNRMLRPFLTSRTIEEAASLHQANDVVVGVNLVTRVGSHYLIGG